MIPIGAVGSVTTSATQAASGPSKAEAPDPSVLKAAKEFESIFVRQMLKSLEKTTAAGGNAKPTAGQSTYGSMIVDYTVRLHLQGRRARPRGRRGPQHDGRPRRPEAARGCGGRAWRRLSSCRQPDPHSQATEIKQFLLWSPAPTNFSKALPMTTVPPFKNRLLELPSSGDSVRRSS